MAMFGKALGNGFAVTSVIGRKEVMQAAQAFISSTFGQRNWISSWNIYIKFNG